MDLGTKNANNLISKDRKISLEAAKAVVNSADTETFKKLCEKSEFIFDFIKEKIVENLCFAVNYANVSNIVKFTKIYNAYFEDFIVKSWVNFANEDLTDEILELFESGIDEQKTYAAGYFYYINDPLALEYLNKFAMSNYEPLAGNCARALNKFKDDTLYKKSLDIVQNAEVDDFEKYKYINFLTTYGDKNALPALFNYLQNTYAKGFAATSVLYLTSLTELSENRNLQDALKIFDILLGAYPEEISLETVFDFDILNYIKYLTSVVTEQSDTENSYIKRILLKAKYKFNLISKEDIYTFDLDKNTKKEINNISNFINTINIDLFGKIEKELLINDKERILEVLDVILNFGKTEFAQNIANTINSTDFEDVISEGVKVLKTFNKLELINKENIIQKLNNENIRAIVKSYFN